ncbi:hypothetical protein pb186bvf_015166 [Paramecium bursaria]
MLFSYENQQSYRKGDAVEDLDQEEEILPVQKVVSISTLSKTELDHMQTSFNTRRRPSRISQVSEKRNSALTLMNRSFRISIDNFVTLKQRNWEDHYQIGSLLGKGSYGHVRQVGIIRAMKSIKKTCLILEDQQRMLSDINILKTLDHPNIVRVYEFFQDDTHYHIITEYLSGGELFSKIKQNSHFSERITADYMRQILRAVSHCHEKQIVHRDLKPENIIFSNEWQLKIIDFGTSRQFDGSTFMRKRLGTPYYIAPEVLSQEYNEKADVWSCGVIMYILLCGYPPFAGRTDQDTLKKVKEGKLLFDVNDWSLISNQAQDLVKKMLTLDPKQRLSAKQALTHQWVLNNTQPNFLNKQALGNLIKFQAQSHFQKAMISFIVSQTIMSQEMKDLQSSFMAMDRNQDGLLSKTELISAYADILNKEEADQKVQAILESVDINLSGQVDYSEFIMAASNLEKVTSIQHIKQAFQMLDLNHDGYLSRDELEEVMGQIGEDVWEQYLLDCDYNKDGQISEQEFTNALLQKF